MATPRTVTIAQAGAVVRNKVTNVMAGLDEGGDTEDTRKIMTRYFARQRAIQMLGNILADETTATPQDVRDTFELSARGLLEQAIFQAAI